MPLPAGETVVRIRLTPGGRDRFGDPVGTTEDRLTIPGCAVAPRQGGEQIGDGRYAVTSGIDLYAPAGADILPSDRVEVRGVVYEVTGEPADWASPYSGRRPGMLVQLTRVAEGVA
ncbi:MAG TPA: hypothetical protein VFR99_05325 [Marmoricola sp.]|nr:hypothetical protein [Marmoricola sp.]